MKKKLLSALMLCSLGLVVGCGDDDGNTPPPTDNTPKLDSQANILAFLDGKTVVMEGANIPSHPNGFSENLDLGPNSQCYSKVTILGGGQGVTVDSDLGTIQNGACNREAKRDGQPFATTSVAIQNVAADGSCFDVDFNFNGFAQQGRGSFSADRKTLKLELFFSGQATGNRCANGAVGAPNTVTLNKAPFTGNAVQTYVIP
ncbi:hypothetical protein ACLESD_04025 [Pyxidicoccus sp. 3LFB2]